MIGVYIRTFLLPLVLICNGIILCMDNSQILAQATQDLLDNASIGNCAGIRNALLNRGANPNCFGIVKTSDKSATPTTTFAAPNVTETAGMLVASLLPTTPAPRVSPKPALAVPYAPIIECTPLHLAAKNGHYDAVKMLLEAGAQVQLSTRNNTTTPLHAAIQSDKRDVKTLSKARKDIAELLIKHGASLHAQDFVGKTALDYLCPGDKDSTDNKNAIISNYKWTQGIYYSKWVCGALVIGALYLGIQKLYNKYRHKRHHTRAEDTQETQSLTENGAHDEKQ